jgi:hypothetical protein
VTVSACASDAVGPQLAVESSAVAFAPSSDGTRDKEPPRWEELIRTLTFAQRHAPLRNGTACFYPQRLLMAMALSTWTYLCLMTITYNLFVWLEHFLVGIARTRDSVGAWAEHTDSWLEMTAVGRLPLLVMAALGRLPLLASARSLEEVRRLVQAVRETVTWLQLIYIVLCWRGLFVSYKRRVFKLRAGVEFIDMRTIDESKASCVPSRALKTASTVCPMR